MKPKNKFFFKQWSKLLSTCMHYIFDRTFDVLEKQPTATITNWNRLHYQFSVSELRCDSKIRVENHYTIVIIVVDIVPEERWRDLPLRHMNTRKQKVNQNKIKKLSKKKRRKKLAAEYRVTIVIIIIIIFLTNTTRLFEKSQFSPPVRQAWKDKRRSRVMLAGGAVELWARRERVAVKRQGTSDPREPPEGHKRNCGTSPVCTFPDPIKGRRMISRLCNQWINRKCAQTLWVRRLGVQSYPGQMWNTCLFG